MVRHYPINTAPPSTTITPIESLREVHNAFAHSAVVDSGGHRWGPPAQSPAPPPAGGGAGEPKERVPHAGAPCIIHEFSKTNE